MKNLKKNVLMFFVVSSLFLVGCKNDSATVSEPLTSVDATSVVQSDDSADEIDNFVDVFFTSTEYAAKSDVQKSAIDNCATTKILLNGNNKTVIIDFGSGCTLANGNTVSGKIIMTYSKDTTTSSVTITYTLENFSFNDLSVEANNTIVHMRQNANGNPQSVITFNTKVTWPDGTFVTRKGEKMREWVAGKDTLHIFGDNAYLITGNWTTTFKNGAMVNATVKTALRREMSCKYFVSGVIEFEKDGKTATLDFGDGNCDNKTIFTGPNGVSTEINLRDK